MKMIWCRDIEDLVNISRAHGWLFHFRVNEKHYYYVYTGVENELLCLVVATDKPLEGKYVSIDDEGRLKQSNQPILPSCTKIVEVERDGSFERALQSSKG